MPDRHERWVLEWNDRRLAVLDDDVEAIVRTHAKDRKVAAWFQDTAEAFAEIGETTLAIDWARQALDFGLWHQSLKAADYWCELLDQHRPGEVPAARLLVFRRWQTSATAAWLHKAADRTWPDYRDEVVATLAASPSDAVLFALLILKDTQFAWNLAHSLGLDDDRTWSELVKAYEKVEPLAVLPIHARPVENELTGAGAQVNQIAARRLAKMRKLAAGSDEAVEVDDFIAGLRETYRRRPRRCKRSTSRCRCTASRAETDRCRPCLGPPHGWCRRTGGRGGRAFWRSGSTGWRPRVTSDPRVGPCRLACLEESDPDRVEHQPIGEGASGQVVADRIDGRNDVEQPLLLTWCPPKT